MVTTLQATSNSTCPARVRDDLPASVTIGSIPTPEWELTDPRGAEPGEDLVTIGGGLDPGTVLTAYARGLFPMEVAFGAELGGGSTLGWWSPDPRGVLFLDSLRVSRSLHRSMQRFTTTRDVAFAEVMRACADPSRPHGWITDQFVEAYTQLHRLGFAHSVEVWRGAELVGGLYGVEIGGLFAGESMLLWSIDYASVPGRGSSTSSGARTISPASVWWKCRAGRTSINFRNGVRRRRAWANPDVESLAARCCDGERQRVDEVFNGLEGAAVRK
jgi:leucyl/phenylalanyl-tRNA--protein transferase